MTSRARVPRADRHGHTATTRSAGRTSVAVRAARRAGWPLVIAAKLRDPAERAYFDQQVRPLLGAGHDMPAEQPLAARVDLMRHAAALLNPITWPEPFGLVMAEALAAATPVLAFPNGAAPEIIDHGRTGFLCRDEDQMSAAARRVPQIDRRRCRAAAQRRFSLAQMADDYERLYRTRLYRTILDHPGQLTSSQNGNPARCYRALAGTASPRRSRPSQVA